MSFFEAELQNTVSKANEILMKMSLFMAFSNYPSRNHHVLTG